MNAKTRRCSLARLEGQVIFQNSQKFGGRMRLKTGRRSILWWRSVPERKLRQADND